VLNKPLDSGLCSPGHPNTRWFEPGTASALSHRKDPNVKQQADDCSLSFKGYLGPSALDVGGCQIQQVWMRGRAGQLRMHLVQLGSKSARNAGELASVDDPFGVLIGCMIEASSQRLGSSDQLGDVLIRCEQVHCVRHGEPSHD
jgi:hypothetical protein